MYDSLAYHLYVPGPSIVFGLESFNTDLPAGEELGLVWRLRSYGWVRGLKFRVLYRHPVVTSARTKGGMATIVVSYLVAFVLFPINALLPKHLCIRGGWTLLDYWYGPRN